MADRYLDVMLAVNDPDSGMPGNHCSDAHFPAGIQLECGSTEPVFRIVAQPDGRTPGRFRLGRQVYRFRKRQCWVGNWSWDMFTMPRREAVRLATNLLGRGFTCTAATGDERYPDLLRVVDASHLLRPRGSIARGHYGTVRN